MFARSCPGALLRPVETAHGLCRLQNALWRCYENHSEGFLKNENCFSSTSKGLCRSQDTSRWWPEHISGSIQRSYGPEWQGGLGTDPQHETKVQPVRYLLSKQRQGVVRRGFLSKGYKKIYCMSWNKASRSSLLQLFIKLLEQCYWVAHTH